MKTNTFSGVLLISIFLFSCGETVNKKSTEVFPVISPYLSDIELNLDYVADIQSVQFVEVRAMVGGYVQDIHVDEGASVKKGQLLFTLNNPTYREELSKASAVLKSNIAEAKITEQELNNSRILLEKNIISKSEFNILQSKYEVLEAKIEEAKADYSRAQQQLSYTIIKAPFDGTIDRIPNKKGSLINEGDLLTSISDNSSIFAYFNVSENEYLNIISREKNLSDEISLILANDEIHKHKGKIETVDGTFDKNTGTISFRVKFLNPELILKHGSTGKVVINSPVKNALIIPQKCSFEIQDKYFVYVLDKNNRLKMQKITIKNRLPNYFVLSSGVDKNDRILYEGIQNVKEGDIIEPKIMHEKEMIVQYIKK